MMYVHPDLGPALVEFACSPCLAFLLVFRLSSTILVIWKHVAASVNKNGSLLQHVVPEMYCWLEIYWTWTLAGLPQHVYMAKWRIIITGLVNQFSVLIRQSSIYPKAAANKSIYSHSEHWSTCSEKSSRPSADRDWFKVLLLNVFCSTEPLVIVRVPVCECAYVCRCERDINMTLEKCWYPHWTSLVIVVTLSTYRDFS